MTKRQKTPERPRILLSNRCIILNKRGEILLIRRSIINEHFGGQWEFPGGKLDQGQDCAHALEREVLEETGLVVVPTTRIAFVESEFLAKGTYKGLPFVCITGIGKTEGSEQVVLSKEHDKYLWIKKNDFFKYKTHDYAKKPFPHLRTNCAGESRGYVPRFS